MKNTKKSDKAVAFTGIVPLNDQILLKAVVKKDVEEKNKFGIIVPTSSQEDYGALEAVVVAVHEPKIDDKGKEIPLMVKVGDRVLFPKHLNTDTVEFEGEKYLFIGEYNIFGIIK